MAVVLQMLIQGMGDGTQPLISRAYGAGDYATVRRYRNTNYCFTIGMGAAGAVIVFALRYAIPAFFGASGATALLSVEGLWWSPVVAQAGLAIVAAVTLGMRSWAAPR